jgi:hypothetical protein
VWGIATLLLSSPDRLVHSGPLMQVARSANAGVELLSNGDFEKSSGKRPTGWQAAPNGYLLVPGAGRQASSALVCENADENVWSGVSQTITLNRTNPAPLIVHGWSRAENVSGGADNNYSIYVDLTYQDGTPLWGQTANFQTGTHDWQEREMVIIPRKPVRSATVHCLLRQHSGKAWFDDVSLREMTSGSGEFLFQGVAVSPVQPASEAASTRMHLTTQDGLSLGLRGSSVESLSLAGGQFASTAPSGFMVRDVMSNSDFYGFIGGDCAELGLRLKSEIRAEPDHLVISGRISDLRQKDRAVTLVFALPLDATGWRWGDDIHRSRIINDEGDFDQVVSARCGATGTLSLYPLAAISGRQVGLGLALDLGHPAQYRLGYHAGTKQLYIAYDFGLVPETQRFPASADFQFILFRFDPRWGFRAAWEKYTGIFKDYFTVRSQDQGLWMPFTDISTVQGWEDFGFKYHEGNNNVPWDDAHGILSFRYTEPMTWWMPMAKDVRRRSPEVLRERDRLAAAEKGDNREMALISRSTAMFDETGQPALLFRNEPWCNGAVWSLNPNPGLPGTSVTASRDSTASIPVRNAATLYWNDAAWQQLYGPTNLTHLDGEYLDSLEGYVTADLNFRRDHFAFSSVPLTFTTDTHVPALFKGLAVFELTRWLGQEVHRLGKLMFANGVPYRFSFLCPWLDVMGTETDWVRNGEYYPASDEQMCLWRTLAGAKPYLLLMNTDYDVFNPSMVERYFQRSLAYGMFPGMFSHNAAENPYWRNPKWYNRDRPLFKKYLPLIKQVSEAGWQPVPASQSDNDRIWIERFGPRADGATYLTVFNDTDKTQEGSLKLDTARLSVANAPPPTEVLSGKTFSSTSDWKVSLAPQEVWVIKVMSRLPGPNER